MVNGPTIGFKLGGADDVTASNRLWLDRQPQRIGEEILQIPPDFQCCGNPTNNRPEIRRQIEAREVRGAIQRVLAKRKVDAIILAGDLNLVFSATPLALLTNLIPSLTSLLSPQTPSIWTEPRFGPGPF